MILAGTITDKMKPSVRLLYDQMPDPKWVVAMGNCQVSGGIFYYDTYSVVRGADEFLPVDVYISGCPPRPESLQDGSCSYENSCAPNRSRQASVANANCRCRTPKRRPTAVQTRGAPDSSA